MGGKFLAVAISSRLSMLSLFAFHVLL